MTVDTARKEKFRQKRRLEIISAASRVLSDKGLNGFTVKDVSESMGIGRGTLYEHIRTKNDILYIIMEDALIKSAQVLREEVAGIEDPILKLKQAIHAHIRTIRQHSVVVLSLYQDTIPLEKDQFRRIRDLVNDYQRIFQEILEYGRDQGVFEFEDGHLLSHSITAILNTWMLKKNFIQRKVPFDQYERVVGGLVLKGLLRLDEANLELNRPLLREILTSA